MRSDSGRNYLAVVYSIMIYSAGRIYNIVVKMHVTKRLCKIQLCNTTFALFHHCILLFCHPGLQLNKWSNIDCLRSQLDALLRFYGIVPTCARFCHTVHLTHWGRVTHICVVKLTIIGSDNGLSPGRRQAIIWTNAGILLIGPLGTNFIEILIGIQTFSFKKIHLKMSSAKWCPFCLGLNVLKHNVSHVTW